MAEIIKDLEKGTPWYMYIMIVFSIGLLIGAFICPPVGQIDVSVYKSVAILFSGVTALRLVDNIPLFIERGAKIRAKLGDATIELEKKESEQ